MVIYTSLLRKLACAPNLNLTRTVPKLPSPITFILTLDRAPCPLSVPDGKDEEKVSGDEVDEEAALAAAVRADAVEATAPTQVHGASAYAIV